jgi:hypothetical protein
VTRAVLLIPPTGTTRELEKDELDENGIPSLEKMQECVGGYIEIVSVVRPDLPGLTLTRMVVNEEGFIKNLPRNPRASTLYAEISRRQFPNSAEPWKDAERAWRASLPKGVLVINAVPPNLRDLPPTIFGTALLFAGWTLEELAEAGL